MPGIASAATAVVIGHVAGGTATIRVGAGGIMLPNHAPLVIAEQFGTLASLYPRPHRPRPRPRAGHRPGDRARAAPQPASGADSFPQDVVELLGYFGRREPGQRVRAVPGAGTQVPVWILGSSLFGAQLAAHSACPTPSPRTSRPAHDAGDRGLPRAASSPSEQLAAAVRDARRQRLRRRHRRRGAAPVHLAAAGLRQSAPRPPGPAAAAGRRHRRRRSTRRRGDGRARARLLGDRRAGHGAARARGLHRPPPAPTS